jgi:hypothetical protein
VTVTVSHRTLVKLGLSQLNFGWLNYKSAKRLFLLERSEDVEDGKILLSPTACINMSACVGDLVTLCKGPVPMVCLLNRFDNRGA